MWTSKSRRWTRRELDREREEFFDTRVAGRPEIWLTLKTALQVLWAGEEGDEGGMATAQTILEAADMTLPTGDLANGVYDAFGALYSLPEWVVSDPVNLVVDDDEVVEEGLVKASPEVADEEEEAARRREEKGKAVLAAADIIAVKARLSDRGGADVTVQVGRGDSVRLLTKRIFEESGVSVFVSRLYFSTYILYSSNLTLHNYSFHRQSESRSSIWANCSRKTSLLFRKVGRTITSSMHWCLTDLLPRRILHFLLLPCS